MKISPTYPGHPHRDRSNKIINRIQLDNCSDRLRISDFPRQSVNKNSTRKIMTAPGY